VAVALKQDEFFLGQLVGPEFYREDGKALFRRYHRALVVPVALDAPLSLWLAITQRFSYAFSSSGLAMIMTMLFYNVIAVHFSSRAMALAVIKKSGRHSRYFLCRTQIAATIPILAWRRRSRVLLAALR